MWFQHLSAHVPTLVGAALLILPVDGLILLFRLMGLPRVTAVYAGLLAFSLLGTLIARRCLSARTPRYLGEVDHG